LDAVETALVCEKREGVGFYAIKTKRGTTTKPFPKARRGWIPVANRLLRFRNLDCFFTVIAGRAQANG